MTYEGVWGEDRRCYIEGIQAGEKFTGYIEQDKEKPQRFEGEMYSENKISRIWGIFNKNDSGELIAMVFARAHPNSENRKFLFRMWPEKKKEKDKDGLEFKGYQELIEDEMIVPKTEHSAELRLYTKPFSNK